MDCRAMTLLVFMEVGYTTEVRVVPLHFASLTLDGKDNAWA